MKSFGNVSPIRKSFGKEIISSQTQTVCFCTSGSPHYIAALARKHNKRENVNTCIFLEWYKGPTIIKPKSFGSNLNGKLIAY